MSKTRYLDFPVKFLEGSGLSSSSSLARKIASICFFLPITFLLTYLVLRKFWDQHLDVLLIAELFESLTTCAHLLSRKYVMFVYGNLIKELINDRYQKFWKYDICGQHFGGALEQKMKICTIIIKVVVSGGVVTIGLFCLTTLIDRTKLVPLICWLPNNHLLIGVIYIVQVLVMFEIMWVLLSLDCFYLLICTDIRIQFILLQKIVKRITFEENTENDEYRKFVLCTKHHNFLLSFHAKINKVVSTYFIVLYLLTVACASMHSYIIMFRSPSIGDSIKSIFYLSGMLIQVGLYFVITSNVEIEAENFLGEVYNINWENSRTLKIRKHMLFMLMKAQEPVSITGGGMLHVNRNEYVGLVRLAYSIATILGGMT